MQHNFTGRTVLVTGAAQGLGFAIAKMFSENGANVALIDLNPQVEQSAQKLNSGKGFALARIADVTNGDSVASMRDSVLDEVGRVDILINNAGKYLPQKIEDITEQDFDDLIAINLKSVFLITQAFMKSLASESDGRIVNIASNDAYVAKVTNAHYAAAKAGVVSLTKTFAEELAPNVLVNGVSPGPIATDTAKTQGWLMKAISRNPLARAAEPEDIGEVVLFLASQSNRFMSGETVVVNGGYSMI